MAREHQGKEENSCSAGWRRVGTFAFTQSEKGSQHSILSRVMRADFCFNRLTLSAVWIDERGKARSRNTSWEGVAIIQEH